MIYHVDSGVFIKTLSAAIAFMDIKDELTFIRVDSGLVIYKDAPQLVGLFFRVPVTGGDEPSFTKYTLAVKDIKPVSTLNASVVEDAMTLDFTSESVTVKSNVTFDIACRAETVSAESGWGVGDVVYQDTAVVKTLSKYLSKLSKDNFKGCFMCSETGFVLPGLFHLTHIPTEIEADPQAYALKSVQLNKLVKLGQDISILPGGRIISHEDITFLVTLPKAPKESALATKIPELDGTFSDDLPCLTILEPKTFKTFLKNTKSDDKQYDLCSIRTENERIVINFYRDKQASNSFVYSNVDTPSSSIEMHLQTKHLLALAELAVEKIEVRFSSNFEPLKIVVDGAYTMYLMQGVVV